MSYKGTVTGFTNPVLCLKHCAVLMYGEDQVDLESFDRVAKIVGEASPEDIANGFFINNQDDMQKLAEVANISVTLVDGKVTANDRK